MVSIITISHGPLESCQNDLLKIDVSHDLFIYTLSIYGTSKRIMSFHIYYPPCTLSETRVLQISTCLYCSWSLLRNELVGQILRFYRQVYWRWWLWFASSNTHSINIYIFPFYFMLITLSFPSPNSLYWLLYMTIYGTTMWTHMTMMDKHTQTHAKLSKLSKFN